MEIFAHLDGKDNVMVNINMKDVNEVVIMDKNFDTSFLPTEHMVCGETLLPSDVSDAEEIHDWIMQLSNNSISSFIKE